MIVANSGKDFERPDSGDFLGTIIDVVDLGIKRNKFGEDKARARFIWVLDKNDSSGNPFRVMWEVNQTMGMTKDGKKSNLYEIAEGVLGTAPPVPFDTETLVGRSNKLIVVKTLDGKYANIKAILPLPAGATPPAAPAGFVRAKDKVATTVRSAAPAVAAANTTASTPTAQPTVQAAAPIDAAF